MKSVTQRKLSIGALAVWNIHAGRYKSNVLLFVLFPCYVLRTEWQHFLAFLCVLSVWPAWKSIKPHLVVMESEKRQRLFPWMGSATCIFSVVRVFLTVSGCCRGGGYGVCCRLWCPHRCSSPSPVGTTIEATALEDWYCYTSSHKTSPFGLRVSPPTPYVLDWDLKIIGISKCVVAQNCLNSMKMQRPIGSLGLALIQPSK